MGCCVEPEKVTNMIVTKVDGHGEHPVVVHTFYGVNKVFDLDKINGISLRNGMNELYENYLNMKKGKELEKFELKYSDLVDRDIIKTKVYWAWIDDEYEGGPYKKHEINSKVFDIPLRRKRIRCLELLLVVNESEF